MSSVSSAGAPGQYQIAVAKLQLDSVEQQGKDAIALIESSVAPAGATNGAPANAAQGVGTHLNYTA
jgi:hypothetical protein